MSSNMENQEYPILEPIYKAKGALTGPELITNYYPNENHLLFSSLDGNLILYNCNRRTKDFCSKIELTTKTLTPIISMTYNSTEKSIVFLDACNYIHYDNLEDTSNHRCVKHNIEDIESITHLINNEYFIKTSSCVNYIYDIYPDEEPKSPLLIIKPRIKYTFDSKPTSTFKTDTHFYIGCQRCIYRLNLKNFHTRTPKVIYELNILNNKNINDENEGIITSIFYYDPQTSCYKDNNNDNTQSNDNKYNLYENNKTYSNSNKIDDIEQAEEEEIESDEDNSDELLILGNNLGKVEVVPMDDMDKKFSFKCFVRNDIYEAVTAITYDNIRQNIYIGGNMGGLYGFHVENKKKIFFYNKFNGGIYGMVYIPKLDTFAFSVTDFEDEIFSDENYMDIKDSKNRKKYKDIVDENNNEDEENKKDNLIIMINYIDQFSRYVLQKMK